MVANDNACLLAKRGALESIASKLAPTGTTALRLTAGFFVPGFQAKKRFFTESRETQKQERRFG